jgi:hypothetical protein
VGQRIVSCGLQVHPLRLTQVIEPVRALGGFRVVTVGHDERRESLLDDRGQYTQSLATICAVTVYEDHPGILRPLHVPGRELAELRGHFDLLILHAEGSLRIVGEGPAVK